jgi:hypothetical protein
MASPPVSKLKALQTLACYSDGELIAALEERFADRIQVVLAQMRGQADRLEVLQEQGQPQEPQEQPEKGGKDVPGIQARQEGKEGVAGQRSPSDEQEGQEALQGKATLASLSSVLMQACFNKLLLRLVALAEDDDVADAQVVRGLWKIAGMFFHQLMGGGAGGSLMKKVKALDKPRDRVEQNTRKDRD